MTKLGKILIETAMDAGAYLRKNAFECRQLEWKGEDNPVTIHDKTAEKMIYQKLKSYGPCTVIGEEGSRDVHSDTLIKYYVDPIDGTEDWTIKNFDSTVSIGAEHQGKLIGGVVYDFMKNILYISNGIDRYLLHDGRKKEFARNEYGMIRVMTKRVKGLNFPEDTKVRPAYGSTALHIAKLAAGVNDCIMYSPGRGETWDIAGGVALLDPKQFSMYNAKLEPFDHKRANEGMIFVRKSIESQLSESIMNWRKKEARRLLEPIA